jgi:hypothetical protein
MSTNPFLANKHLSTPAQERIARTPSPIISPLHDPRQKKAVVQIPNKVLGESNRESHPGSCVINHSKLTTLLDPQIANPIIPGQITNTSGEQVYQQGLGQKALLAKRFAKTK